MHDLVSSESVGFNRPIKKKLPRGGQCQVVGKEAKQQEKDDEVEKQNDDGGKDDALSGKVGLTEVKHADREGEMETPENTEAKVENRLVSLERIPKIDADPKPHPDQRVNGNEVG